MHISDSQQQSEEEIPPDGSTPPGSKPPAAAPVSEGSGCASDVWLTKNSLNSEMMTLCMIKWTNVRNHLSTYQSVVHTHTHTHTHT